VRTSEGELPADPVVVCTKKQPRNDLAAAGLEIGSTGGIVVDERMATSVAGVFAAGDCIVVAQMVSEADHSGAEALRRQGLLPRFSC
jgi:thioredoxin reductase